MNTQPWSRFDGFTKSERHMFHHALRVLLTHPIRMLEDEEILAKALADELWDQHAREVKESRRELYGEDESPARSRSH